MKNKNFFLKPFRVLIPLALLALTITMWSCQENSIIDTSLDQIDSPEYSETMSASDRASAGTDDNTRSTRVEQDNASEEILIDCLDLQTGTNNMKVRVKRVDCEFDDFCFLEEEIITVLTFSGYNNQQIEEIMEQLFSQDSDGDLCYDIGTVLYDFLQLDPQTYTNCYRSHVIGNGPLTYSNSNGSQPAPPACNYGVINFFATSYSLPEPGGCTLTWIGSNSIKLEGNCGLAPVNIPASDAIIVSVLSGLGWSQQEIDQMFFDLRNGQMTVRDFFNLFQYQIVPNHPEFLAMPHEERNCRYITVINKSVFDSSTAGYGLITVRGKANLYCGPQG